METHLHLGQRRIAAQLYAVSRVEREIRAADPHSRRKYLREFAEAYETYRAPLTAVELSEKLLGSDVLLIGDYHALPACQLYAATLLEQLAAARERPIVLALEAVFARDQHILNDWLKGQIDERELRDRIRFDMQWGFGWEPFLRLLHTAREVHARIYGIDCMPRGNLRRISARDEHAAERIAAIATEMPEAQIVVLFGESHMAPQHLPAAVKHRLPMARTLTLLQNIDSLYWKAEGESGARVGAVQVADDVLCVFNATPLEKYESYRQYIALWRQERSTVIDLAPAFYNVISALLRFLGIDQYRMGTPQYPMHHFPEVNLRTTAEQFLRPLQRKIADEQQARELIRQIKRDGCSYCVATNSIYALRFDLSSAALAAARFVHAACSGWLSLEYPAEKVEYPSQEDRFYVLCLTEAIAEFGARILHSARRTITEQDLYSYYSRNREDMESLDALPYDDYMRIIDFVVLHKDFECNARLYRRIPELITEGRNFTGNKLRIAASLLGQLLAGQFYKAYLEGRVNRRYLRSLYVRRLNKPGEPKLIYFQLARRTRSLRRRLAA